jgi:hypothetical protein
MVKSSQRLRIIVAGMAAQYPVGGVAWDYLQYAIGLRRLGHEIVYHEDTWCWPYHPLSRTMTDDPAYSAAYLRDFFVCYAPELAESWHYLHLHETSFGMSRAAFDDFARTADLFINVSGGSFFPETLSPSCLKLFVDTDPGYNQIVLSERPSWSENVERWCAGVRAHAGGTRAVAGAHREARAERAVEHGDDVERVQGKARIPRRRISRQSR